MIFMFALFGEKLLEEYAILGNKLTFFIPYLEYEVNIRYFYIFVIATAILFIPLHKFLGILEPKILYFKNIVSNSKNKLLLREELSKENRENEFGKIEIADRGLLLELELDASPIFPNAT